MLFNAIIMRGNDNTVCIAISISRSIKISMTLFEYALSAHKILMPRISKSTDLEFSNLK